MAWSYANDMKLTYLLCLLLFHSITMAFRLLLTRIGFSGPQATAFIGEGIAEPRDLSTYTHSDLKGLFKHLASRAIHPPYM
ncbi:MAG: hypothetical protein ACK53Y_14100, partial [bacterium]